jgi:hypothetical protein
MMLTFQLFGEKVVLNEDSFEIDGDKIFIVNKNHKENDSSLTARINFAACWNGGGMDSYVVSRTSVNAPRFILPPITFHQSVRGIQLSVDYFKNDWSVKVDLKRTVPLPKAEYTDEDPEDSFHDAAQTAFFGEKKERDWEDSYNRDDRLDLEGDVYKGIPSDEENGDSDSSDDENDDDSVVLK